MTATTALETRRALRPWWAALEIAAAVAAVVLDPGAHPTPEELHDHARESLTGYKVPRRYVVLDELPVNAMGKVLRREVVTAIRGR